MTPEELLKKLTYIRLNVNNILDNSILENKEEIFKKNQNQLYNEGMDSERVLLPHYAPSTVRYKQSNGAKYSNTTLNDTGDFYSKFYLNVDKKGVTILSRGKNTASLINTYGINIFGLVEESQSEVNVFVQESMDKQFHEILEIN